MYRHARLFYKDNTIDAKIHVLYSKKIILRVSSAYYALNAGYEITQGRGHHVSDPDIRIINEL